MRQLALIAVAAGLCTAALAGPDHYRARTASELVVLCTTPESSSEGVAAVAFCHGVLTGAFAYYQATTPVADRTICAPNPTPTRTQFADGFVAWTKARPDRVNENSIDALFRFATETYPCKR